MIKVRRVKTIVEDIELDEPFSVDIGKDGTRTRYLPDAQAIHNALRRATGERISVETQYAVHCEDEEGCTVMLLSDKEH